MSWIRHTSEDEAAKELSAIYDRARSRSSRGAVSNLWQVQGLDPPGLAATYGVYEALMGDPAPLTVAQAELIAVVVSATNGSAYCVAHHGPRLARALGDETLARAVALDYRQANLTARDRVILDFAVALTCEPSERKLEDVERVKEYGLDDAAILRVTEITAFYGMLNRVASGLGVELEPGVTPWEYGSQK